MFICQFIEHNNPLWVSRIIWMDLIHKNSSFLFFCTSVFPYYTFLRLHNEQLLFRFSFFLAYRLHWLDKNIKDEPVQNVFQKHWVSRSEKKFLLSFSVSLHITASRDIISAGGLIDLYIQSSFHPPDSNYNL